MPTVYQTDRLRACLKATLVSLCDIQSRWDRAHWLGIDRLRVVSRLTLIEDEFYLDWYSSGRSFKSTAFTTKVDIVNLSFKTWRCLNLFPWVETEAIIMDSILMNIIIYLALKAQSSSILIVNIFSMFFILCIPLILYILYIYMFILWFYIYYKYYIHVLSLTQGQEQAYLQRSDVLKYCQETNSY